MYYRNLKYFSNIAKNVLASSGGNFAIMGAVILPVVLVAAGGAVDLANAYARKKDMQERLDAGVLAAAPQSKHSDRERYVAQFMSLVGTSAVDKPVGGADQNNGFVAGSDNLQVVSNPDGSVTANFSIGYRPSFLSMIGMNTMTIGVTATAYAEAKPQNQTCIYALSKEPMGLRINSGVNIYSKHCEIAVYSDKTGKDAFFAAADARIDTAKFCVKGTQYNNHAKVGLKNLVPDCTPPADPYAGKIPAPTIPNTCSTQGVNEVKNVSVKPGKHCSTQFRNNTKITFEPGVHIISGTVLVDGGPTIIAEGVTFYFPNSDSELRPNGGVTTIMKAPTSGPYKGILMFETPTKKNAPFIFNGSISEQLEGVIYLPSRDVTFNSNTKQVSKITLVVNSAIMNPNDWKIEPYDGGLGGKTSPPRLLK